VREIHPLEFISKILKASKRLKSERCAKEILAFSSSLSKEICSLKALTSSSSTSNRRGNCYLIGELALIVYYVCLKPLKCDSLRGEDSLIGVYILWCLLWAADFGLKGEPYCDLTFKGELYVEALSFLEAFLSTEKLLDI
jgi:hypothetical protein